MLNVMKSMAMSEAGLPLQERSGEAALPYLKSLQTSSVDDHEIPMTVLAACASTSLNKIPAMPYHASTETGDSLSDAYASGVPQRSLCWQDSLIHSARVSACSARSEHITVVRRHRE